MIPIKYLSNSFLLASLAALVIVSVLVFNVFQFSAYYGFVQVNYINSLLLMPFIALVISFGFILGKAKQQPENKFVEVCFQLTSREKEIVELLLQGKKNQEIADHLFVELSTVKTHINNIYKKTDAKNRRELKKRVSNIRQ
jgi:DNA-binding CsgD family transcriptional regulator